MIARVVVINDLAQPKGGATALALLSARLFRARGIAVTFITGDEGANPALAALGVEIVALGQARLTAAPFAKSLIDGVYNKAAYRLVAQWIAANDTPDTVYHLHGWAQILSPAVFHALQPVQTRLILSAHDFFLACPNGSFAFLKSGKICTLTPMSATCVAASCDRRHYAHKLWRVARQSVQRLYYDRRRSPPVLAIHERMRPFLMRADIPSDAIEAVPNPVTPYSLVRLTPENNREVLFIGRLEGTKGPDLAAAACRAAGAVLRVIGNGVLRARLEAEYPEMIFMGFQPPEAIADFARSARMLVMPSRYPEPYGLVAAEALWSGLPVIAADSAFLAHDIVSAGAGLAVEPRDVVAFAAAIRTILNDDTLCAAMSHAAFSDMPGVALSPEAWVDRLLDAYSRRLEGARTIP